MVKTDNGEINKLEFPAWIYFENETFDTNFWKKMTVNGENIKSETEQDIENQDLMWTIEMFEVV